MVTISLLSSGLLWSVCFSTSLLSIQSAPSIITSGLTEGHFHCHLVSDLLHRGLRCAISHKYIALMGLQICQHTLAHTEVVLQLIFN